MIRKKVDMLMLRRAIELSWKSDTAYHQVEEVGNPALGQCYVSSRVVQAYFPEVELAQGEVLAAGKIEKHFWNVFQVNGEFIHVDLTWSQFPVGSKVMNWAIRDRETYNDSPPTIERVETLLRRVQEVLSSDSK
ncbi:MAG TPA: hypothetical protein VJ841_01145 [Candidatus Saccharimonadales bacterium]|nr:hypothetical protein [Candidatus Saccharimonadales bacterium]